jgi:hypothetical protein
MMQYTLQTVNEGPVFYTDLSVIERAHYYRENNQDLLLIVRLKDRTIEAYIVREADGWAFLDAVDPSWLAKSP